MEIKVVKVFFKKIFHELYYRIFVLDPLPKCNSKLIDNKIFLEYKYSEKDREKLVRFLNRSGFSSDYIEDNLSFDKTKNVHNFKLKVVIVRGNGDSLQGISIDAFNDGYRFVPSKSVECILTDWLEGKVRDHEFKYLCFPHVISNDEINVTFSEDILTHFSSFEASSKKGHSLRKCNWNNQIGFLFLV